MFEQAEVAAAAAAYLTETAPVAVLRLDTGHRVTAANAQARALLGDAVVGRPFAETLVEFARPGGLATLLVDRDNVHRLTVKTTLGLPETLYFRFYPLADGLLALGSLDLQEQQRLRREMLDLNHELNALSRQLHQANAELRDLNELKNRFLGMAAHDLRKPVGVILAYGEFVLDEAGRQLSEQQQEFLRTCLAAAAGMQRLIDNFLDVSVIESGQLQLDLAAVVGGEILAGVEPLARLLADRKQVRLIVEPDSSSRRLHVDAAKIQQVLQNLLANAIEHSRSGLRVWLTSRCDGEEFVFAVRDEGPGIATADQPRLFAAFTCAGTRKTAGERSVGLGLAIARWIVEAHAGRIWVDSAPGRGATFHVALPARGPGPDGACGPGRAAGS